ncbi:autotransporter outer membrane beta-barrel domain-containing protein [Tritonibacter horizontis]|uniref:Uncharacterized protein n=1 Tax=Tritonibacter horizontis TaxID=1768241 RepID=A0A132BVW1_9RHOB|nr:autotransporter outer membrane beta-barrel domain-containing protein [Tritonibacter horizontis]KUP91947.1 hypothetical protein TRIHO_32510 [Tritonibacter horizontis]
MKNFLKRGAAALSLVVAASQAVADAPPQGAPQLPQSLRGMIALAQSGLLPEYFSNDQFGTVQSRIADMRVTVASAHSPGAPQTGYKDGGRALVFPLSYMKILKDGKSALRFSLASTMTDGDPGQVEIDADIQRVDVQYLRFLSTGTMLSFGAFGELSKAEVIGAGDLERKGFGLRADLLHQISDHWGLAARAEFSFGQSKGALNTPFGLLTRSQGDDRLYLQALMVGQYRKADLAAVPQGWVLHPQIGLQFQRSFIEETTDSFGNVVSGAVGKTESYGTMIAKLRLQKEAGIGQWAPGMHIGLEHELVNDLDEYVDEPTYGLFGLTLSRQMSRNARLDVIYTLHHGLKGNRSHDTLVASLSFAF